MKRLLLLLPVALCLGGNAHAQDLRSASSQFPEKADEIVTDLDPAASFSERSHLPALSLSTFTTAEASLWGRVPTPPKAAPSPSPTFVYGPRDDYRWQLGLGITVVHFASSRFSATGAGTSTSLTYFMNDWFGVEGDANTAFGADHFQYVAYGAGPHVAWRKRKWEPWAHALAGGIHAIPQVATASQNAFAAQVGGGVDYRFYPHLSLRFGVDWVRSHLYSGWQDSVQGIAQLVLHF